MSGQAKRKYKSKSLVVPKIVSDHVDFSDQSSTGSTSPKGFKARFSFRELRRRSRSKSHKNQQQNASESGDLDDCDGDAPDDHHHDHQCDTNLLCQATRNKSSSLIDLKSLCNKFHRHMSSGMK